MPRYFKFLESNYLVFMKTLKQIYGLFKDLLIKLLPNFLVPKKLKKYHFCFLGHPRDYAEIYRKFPFFRKIPKKIMRILIRRFFWPVTASEITGLRSTVDGKEVLGCVITVPMTAKDLLDDRPRAIKQIRSAVRHASKQGAKIVGLAGYTASLSKGGQDLLDLGVDVTTGHAYTALNVVQNYEAILERMSLQQERNTMPLAIVGAAGSVGSTVAKYLATTGATNIRLIDLERKIDKVKQLQKELLEIRPSGTYTVSSDVSESKQAIVIFTATNASEALITTDRTTPGSIYIDDTQPTDISEEVHRQSDVLVLEAGAVRTPGVVTHFRFGLKDREDNFCCMAELLALAANNHKGHYVINRASVEHVAEIKTIGEKLGFRVADFQNYFDTVTEEKIDKVTQLVKKRLASMMI